MERGKITIENGVVSVIPTDDTHTVWMSVWEIARLFGVTTPKVTACIKAIFKSGVLWEGDVFYCHHYDNGNSVELYNLDMITALAFRISSPNTDAFRSWLMERIADYTCKRSNVQTSIRPNVQTSIQTNIQRIIVMWNYPGGTVSLN
jgi:hypothetical protein